MFTNTAESKIGRITAKKVILGAVEISRSEIGHIECRQAEGITRVLLSALMFFLLLFTLILGMEIFNRAHEASMRLCELGVSDHIVSECLRSARNWESFQICCFLPIVFSFICLIASCVNFYTLVIYDRNKKIIYTKHYSLFCRNDLLAFVYDYEQWNKVSQYS